MDVYMNPFHSNFSVEFQSPWFQITISIAVSEEAIYRNDKNQIFFLHQAEFL